MLDHQFSTSCPAGGKDDNTIAAALNNNDDDGIFFDPSVFNQSFFDPNHKQPSAVSMSTKKELINSAAAKAKGRAERHAKEGYLKTIDEQVSSRDNTSCASSQQSVGLGLSEYLSQGTNRQRNQHQLNVIDDFSSCCSISTTETSYTNASHYSSYTHDSSNYSCNTQSSKFSPISASASDRNLRRCASFFANRDQDEEGCCFCPCFTTNDDDDEGNDEQQQNHPNEKQSSSQQKNKQLHQILICNPLLLCFRTHADTCQSILHQHPIFYRLSLRMQQRFPRIRRRASDPIEERPVIVSATNTARLLFLRIHYKSLVMGMILALIIVKFNSSVGDIMLNNDDSLYVTIVPVLDVNSSYSRGEFPSGWNGDWQQQNQQLLESSLGYYNDVSRASDEEEVQRWRSGKQLIDLRGPPPPREGADPADLALDSSTFNQIMQRQWQEQEQEEGRKSDEEEARVEQELLKSNEEWARQQHLNAELARQQEQLQAQEQQPPHHQAAIDDVNLAGLNNLKNTWHPIQPNDIAILWHVPESGSSVVRHAIGGCHRLVQASGFGIRDGHAGDDQVGVFYPSEGSPFVNIDSTTIAGIKRAANMRFADAQVADVVVSPLIHETNELFSHSSKGRFFAVFRHPIERAVRLFYTLQEKEPALREWTLERYSRSTYLENNYLTRQLSKKLEGPLNDRDYDEAKEIIRQKFLVGLASQIDQSLDRYEKYFRWTYRIHPKSQEACRKRLLSEESAVEKKIKKRMPKEGDSTWAWLSHHNAFDLRLYAYIDKLFEEQAVFVKGARKEFRNKDTTCCRCEPATFPDFDLNGNDDDDIPPDDNVKKDGGEEGTQKSTFEGGIRLLRRLPPALISALFVPCTVEGYVFFK